MPAARRPSAVPGSWRRPHCVAEREHARAMRMDRARALAGAFATRQFRVSDSTLYSEYEQKATER
jgi:hypothetical protein